MYVNGSTQHPRVLVVDDHQDTADSCDQLLALWGYESRVAYDGETALEMFQSFRPQIVLLDLEMPGLDGYEVRRRIHALNANATTVIAVSGHGQRQVQDRSRIEGFFCHLTKPVDPLRLQALLSLLSSNTTRQAISAEVRTV